MSELDECRHLLATVLATSYRFRPKTDEPYLTGRKLADMFLRLPANDQVRLRDNIQPTLTKKLLSLSGLMAEHAINRNDISFVRAALVMHLLEDLQNDARENVRDLILVRFAAERLGFAFGTIVDTIEGAASPSARAFLKGFVARPDELNHLSAFEIKEETVDGVFKFVPI